MYNFELKSDRFKAIPYREDEPKYRSIYRELRLLLEDRWFFYGIDACQKAYDNSIKDCIAVCNYFRIVEEDPNAERYFWSMVEEWKYRLAHTRASKNSESIKSFYTDVIETTEGILERMLGEKCFFGVDRKAFVEVRKAHEETLVKEEK